MGRIERHLAEHVAQIDAFDISPKMLERAESYLAKTNNVSLHQTDGQLSMLSESMIDLVISFLVFQHVPKSVTWTYFNEAFRVLKPGGSFLFQILCFLDQTQIDPCDRAPIARYYGRGKEAYTEDEVRTALEDNGFAIAIFRAGLYDGIERRLTGIPAAHWKSMIILARK